MTGGSIIMPIDMRIEATTMSMMRNGTNSRKPISKARLSSLIMNAGTRALSGVSVGASMSSASAMSRNNARSCSRT